MEHNTSRSVVATLVAGFVFSAAAGAAGQAAPSPERRVPPLPPSVRLYVFDCGTLHIADLGRFQLKKEEIATSDLSVACFLVTHPKGTLTKGKGQVLLRQAKPGKGGRDDIAAVTPKLFVVNLAGTQACPAKGGRQPEASLAWWWGNPSCEA